ncbi:hypothetical protein [Alkalihalobacillus sp. BA299]|uniref:hypothetical protein n=1 Tax=Alkalihalobacillus sp. BA299 TaxID=2815938 RepID=UPI001ADC4CC0|nr:hypothetical protein [Alkalihalobacillus sp. BA299]
MKSKLNIENVKVIDNRVEVSYSCIGDIANYLTNDTFFVEYDCKVINVPLSVLAIPFLANVLPIVWASDTIVYCEEIDREFLTSMAIVKKSFQKMYPSLKMRGEIKPNQIVNNEAHYKNADLAAMFFSGGVDSLAAYIQKKHKKPVLLTVWGADIKFDNELGWRPVIDEIQQFANSVNTKVSTIKSNFKEILNYSNLSISFKEHVGGHWWPQVQHGLALIGLSAPYTYEKEISNLYFAATHNPSIVIPFGSHPEIDSNIKWGSKRYITIHQGYELTRYEKIALIGDYIKSGNGDLKLRVCWQSSDGKNCSVCEKCSRTILSMIVNGISPENHGFKIIDYQALQSIKDKIENHSYVTDHNMHYYKDIQSRVATNSEALPKFSYGFFSWFEKANFILINRKKERLENWYSFKGKIKNTINKVINLN